MKKKVCMVVYDFSEIGGVNAVITELMNELVEYYNISLLSIIDTKKKAYNLNENINYKTILSHKTSLRREAIHVRKPAKEYFKNKKFDVIMILGQYPGFLLSTLQPFIKSKMIYCDHGALMNQWNDKKVRFMNWISSTMCQQTVTLTERNMNDYISKFKIPKRKITYIYNWIDLKKQKNDFYDINSKKIVSVGRFGKEKGFDQLVKVFALVSKKHPDWSLDICGDGETMPIIKKMIDDYDLNEKVHLLGMRNDIIDLYKDYAMYVLPSYREGLPLVLLEAKVNKLPIVSFDILTGPKEIVRDGIDGILVPQRNIEKMSEAICYLIENSEVRQSMSDQSMGNIEAFSKESILKKWIDLIENMS